jgi:triphosphoribosyl-dephospho-CoA synthase
MERAGERGVGETVLRAVQATRRWTTANTNLGIALLFAPLAKAHGALGAGRKGQGARNETQGAGRKTQDAGRLETRSSENGLRITDYVLRQELRRVLQGLTVQDAIQAYEAIRLAAPGGLEEPVEQHDVRAEPSVTLREAMAAAAERDSIAAEYGSDYALTFERGLPALQASLARGLAGRAAVTQTYLELLGAVPDTLIARKQGRAAAQEVSRGAARVLAAGGMHSAEGRQAVAAFDASLRDPANRLNPGTTADLTAAALFAALLTGTRL